VHRWELPAFTPDRPDPRDVVASFDDEGAERDDDRSAVSGYDPDDEPDHEEPSDE
jgi:hypothetical protein